MQQQLQQQELLSIKDNNNMDTSSINTITFLPESFTYTYGGEV
jgi:hypothetical protein